MDIKPIIEGKGPVAWDDIDWKKNWRHVTFMDSVRIVGFSRGRSAANIRAKSISADSESKRIYTIFLVDFLDMMANGDIKDMVITGTFEVKKRGRNFGIVLKDTPSMTNDQWNRKDWHPIPDYI